MSRGSVIQVVFVDIELESHPDCRHDYVEVSSPSMDTLSDTALHHVVIPPLFASHIPSHIVRVCPFGAALTSHYQLLP